MLGIECSPTQPVPDSSVNFHAKWCIDTTLAVSPFVETSPSPLDYLGTTAKNQLVVNAMALFLKSRLTTPLSTIDWFVLLPVHPSPS